MERKEIYKLIENAKQAVASKIGDRANKDTVVTEAAQTQYMKEARRLFEIDPTTKKLIAPKTPEPLIAAVRKAKTKTTLKKHARSVRHFAISFLKARLKQIDKYQRLEEWDKVERIVTHPEFNSWVVISNMMPADYAGDGWAAKKPRSSKKKSLKGLPLDWREKIADKTEGQFRNAVLVALLTGCRPAELEKGVLIERVNGELYATIKGAKVKINAGQEQRRFRLANHPITDLLKNSMDDLDANCSDMLVKVERGNSVTTHMRSIGEKLWPKNKQSITVYTARHAMAADCKAAIATGVDPDLVSQVLGHVVDKTASYYGARFQSGGESVAPSEVIVPKLIKHKVRIRDKQRAIKLGISKKSTLLEI